MSGIHRTSGDDVPPASDPQDPRTGGPSASGRHSAPASGSDSSGSHDRWGSGSYGIVGDDRSNRAGGAYRTVGPGDPRRSGPYRTTGSGAYPQQSGGHDRQSGGYDRQSGGYDRQSASGDYERRPGGYPGGAESGPYAQSQASGPRRAMSGEYGRGGGTGTHRVVGSDSRWGWRMGLVLGGAVIGVALCAVAIVFVMTRAAAHTTAAGGTGHKTVAQRESSTSGPKMFEMVPDSCSTLTAAQAGALVKNFQQNPSTASDTNYYSQCVWTDFSAGAGRQISVELRMSTASGGKSATDVAHTTFLGEESGDDQGQGALQTGQTVAAHAPVTGYGDEAYLDYSVDGSQGFGQASINMRVLNVLVAVRFGGSDGSKPLSQNSAQDGARQAARQVLTALAATAP